MAAERGRLPWPERARYRMCDLVPTAHARVLENMRDAVLILDRQHRVMEVNPVAPRLVGRPPGHCLGTPVWELVPACPGPGATGPVTTPGW
jgi:PAS domain-containing protein